MVYENNKFTFIDLAVKTLALKPELLKDIASDNDLIDRVIDFSMKLADATPPETHLFS
jgi:hypothetical protein